MCKLKDIQTEIKLEISRQKYSREEIDRGYINGLNASLKIIEEYVKK